MIEIRDRIAGPFSALNGIPATVAEPELGRNQRPERPHGRGLARPVGAEKAEHLAVADLERNVLERDALAEALAQMLNHGAPARRVPEEANRPLSGAASPASLSWWLQTPRHQANTGLATRLQNLRLRANF